MNNIEDAIKRCKELTKPEHSNWIGLTNQSAIKIILGNLEALVDIQKTADRELEKARRINEEHKKENGELREKVKEYLDGIPKQKIKDKIEEIEKEENLYAKTNIIKVLQELLQESEDK